MPPKKMPSKLTGQGSSLAAPTSARTSRQSLPAPPLPLSEDIPSLWMTGAVPSEVFPEWTDPAALPAEHWRTVEEPYEDPVPTSELPLPHEAGDIGDSIMWKRPCQFLPAIVDVPAVPATPPTPIVPEPKATGKKGASAAKKAEPEPPKKPPPPKYAYIFCPKSWDREHGAPEHKKPSTGSGPAHGSGPVVAPSTTSASPATDQQQDTRFRIPRDFQRLWSAEEMKALQAWRKEEARIEREKQNRERVYMAFEDAIAYIVNDRPRDLLEDVDFDAEDLVDDGEDEEEGLGMEADASNGTSPWGVMPPARIEITPNTVFKPEIPHGEIIHADMASYLRIIEQVYEPSEPSATGESASAVPFLWQAIYPQDSTGQPVYNPGGKYSVRLFVFGRWRRVDIDDKLPLDDEGNIMYLSSSMRSEIWPALLVKALYKAMHWMHPSADDTGGLREDRMLPEDYVSQTMAQIVLALTGWKISRWEPRNSQSFSDNVYHQLLQYVPTAQQVEENSETTLEGDSVVENTAEVSAPSADLTPHSSSRVSSKPRAIVCCAGDDRTPGLNFGEAVLVTDIIGDSGNTTFKVVRQDASATISEEATEMDQLVFLLLHPVQKYSDTLLRYWAPKIEEELEETQEAVKELIPFETPHVQFLVVKMPPAPPEQPSGDSSSDMSPFVQTGVNLLATLTPVLTSEKPGEEVDNLRKSSVLMAKHLGVDPDGSVTLLEEVTPNRRKNAATYDGSRSSSPLVVTLDTIASRYICAPSVDRGNLVYRVYPQQSLRYGYSLQIESDHQVEFQDPATYWRNLDNFHVVESDGTYPVMLAETWNILFKQSFEFARPTAEVGGDEPVPGSRSSTIELRLDLHLSEELLARYVHIAIINDATNEVKNVNALCSTVILPAPAENEMKASSAYTIVIDCAPGKFHVREGKWHLTLASDWDLTKSTTQQMSLTSFGGMYEPNKPMLCFRDVVMVPKVSLWTTFQLQLLRGEQVTTNLAVKLEIFDLGGDQQPLLCETSANGEVRLLQLPCSTVSAGGQPLGDDKRGYIVQGSIDRTRCAVPEELCSARPFRNRLDDESPQLSTDESLTGDSPTLAEKSSPIGADQEGGDGSPKTVRSFRAPSDIKWRLNCWSSEEVKLEVDRTKELRYEAIRASWAESAKERDTNGAISRLLYLGKTDEAEAKMKQDGMTEEQMSKIRSRFQWVQVATAKVHAELTPDSTLGEDEGPYLEEIATGEEVLLSADQVEEAQRVLVDRVGAVQADMEQRHEVRAFAKDQRAQEVRDLIHSVIQDRATSAKKQHVLRQQLTALQSGLSTQSA